MRSLNLIGVLLFVLVSLVARAAAAPAKLAPITTGVAPLPVKIVLVTMLEVGANAGDMPGEFQLWKERRHLDNRTFFPQSFHDFYCNPDRQILGVVAGVGSIRTAAAIGLKPFFVLEGDQLSAITFRHGKFLNERANAWVRRWSRGKGEFIASAEEDSGTALALDDLQRAGRAGKARLLVLRSGSNYTTPSPTVTAAVDLAQENQGYLGMRASPESRYLVGPRVVDELLAHRDLYRAAPPQ